MLELECTETMVIRNFALFRELMAALPSRGFRSAMDDFGTGYSSLNMLKEIALDVLKLDKSMVSDVAHNPRTRAIVGSIAEICGKLGIRMVAEGIETEEQMAALNACGVRLAQGFLFGKPVCAGQFEKTYLQQ